MASLKTQREIQAMSNTYLVKLDIAFLEDVEVDADSEQDAIEKAYTASDYRGSILGVFEVEQQHHE